jgi:hypothetical protein
MSEGSVDPLTNFGMVRTAAVEAREPATIIVVGLPRSGTSMIAAVLKELGVYIGSEIDGAVFEDRQFGAAIASGQRSDLTRLIDERNELHSVWGFKRPEAYKQLDLLIGLCRSPRVIVTFRDILAISLRNKLAMQLDPLKLLPRLAEEYRDLSNIITRLAVPSLLVSYEKAVQFPSEIVREIAVFCGVDADDEVISRSAGVIENGTPHYVRGARLRYEGFVGRVVNGRLRGWVKAIGRDDIRVSVDLKLDGKLAETVRADRFRPDVKQAGYGDGRYGFEFGIGNETSRDSIVQVTVHNSDISIKNSGLSLMHYVEGGRRENTARGGR